AGPSRRVAALATVARVVVVTVAVGAAAPAGRRRRDVRHGRRILHVVGRIAGNAVEGIRVPRVTLERRGRVGGLEEPGARRAVVGGYEDVVARDPRTLVGTGPADVDVAGAAGDRRVDVARGRVAVERVRPFRCVDRCVLVEHDGGVVAHHGAGR